MPLAVRPGVCNSKEDGSLLRKSLLAVGLLFLVTSCSHTRKIVAPTQTAIPGPPVFTSANHKLDLLVIAEPKTITLGSFQPTAWVFKMCLTSQAQGDQCPADSRTVNPYGGIRLQLYPGDHLRMRLVNHLPPAPADAEHAYGTDAMMNAMLQPNPVNIHTHGLIVEPRKADAADPTWGDYVYVLGYPAGKLPTMVDEDETATDQPIQYDIYIPKGHPSGMFWFHPHVHGLGVNQLSEGLSGIITIGDVTDYLSVPSGLSTIPVRYLALKDMQVLANGNVLDQEDAMFCSALPLTGVGTDGFCQGVNTSGIPDVRRADGAGGPDYEGGAWFFTINGQVDPQISMSGAPGELWRILNSAASRAYDLVLQDDQTGKPIPFQVVSLDGVSLAPPTGSVGAQIKTETGGKVDPVPCPAETTGSTQPICATHLVLFPSSRAEIWVSPQVQAATLKTLMVQTGPAGDSWPEVNLAHVTVSQPANRAAVRVLNVRPMGKALLSSNGLLGAPVSASFAGLPGTVPLREARQIANGKQFALPATSGTASAHALTLQQIAEIRARMNELSNPVASIASSDCSALPAGHKRRIFFGVPASAPDKFGLGYEEVDANDNALPGTFQDVAQFNPDKVNVCLPLGSGNTPVTEEWELVNLAGEAHNFHIHQTKFYVEPDNAPSGDGGVLMDNVALPTGGASCDGTVATWQSGGCKVGVVTVKIPFSEVGDFVYHCHIGEHQDGGMMAHIRVIASQ
jgi:L-ascorbate oxidase